MKKINLTYKISLIVSVFISLTYIFCYPQTNKILEAEEKEILLQEIEVKEGQTLSYIANYYLKDPKQWPEILKYNKLDTTDIYAPLPGMKLKVPVVIVKEKFRPAYLVYILNKVKYRKRNTVNWEEPTINMELYNDDAIATQENSRANIKFYSGEILSIDENSFVTIRPELKQEEITLHKGSVRATKAKVITEYAEIVPKIDPKLPKTDFRTKIREEDKATLVEVYEGAVDVTAQGKTIYVPKGFGTEVKPLSPPSPIKALPPPPEIKTENLKLSPNNEIIINKSAPTITLQLVEPKIEQKETLPFIPKEQKVEGKTSVEEQPVEKKPKVVGSIVKKYHVQIAKDTEFKKVVYDVINDINQPVNLDFSKLNLPDGKYYYKISYIDELGFENPTAPRPIVIDTTPPKLLTNLENIKKTDKDIIFITGETEPDTILRIQDMNIEVKKDGKFECSVVLKPGVNKILLVAKDIYGNETQLQYEIERVKELTKEEKQQLTTIKEKSEEGKISLWTFIAGAVSGAVVILVLSFFIK